MVAIGHRGLEHPRFSEEVIPSASHPSAWPRRVERQKGAWRCARLLRPGNFRMIVLSVGREGRILETSDCDYQGRRNLPGHNSVSNCREVVPEVCFTSVKLEKNRSHGFKSRVPKDCPLGKRCQQEFSFHSIDSPPMASVRQMGCPSLSTACLQLSLEGNM